MNSIRLLTVCGLATVLTACSDSAAKKEEARELEACKQMVLGGLLKIPDARDMRFLGKVAEATAICRGGQKAAQFRMTPWVDWSQYWGTGDMQSLPKDYLSSKGPALRGVTGALMDLEYQRIELIKFGENGVSLNWVINSPQSPETRRITRAVLVFRGHD